jgi:hypothetical protein
VRRILSGGTAFNRKYAEQAGKVPGICEKEEWVFSFEGCAQQLAEIAILISERNATTIILK